MEGAFYLHHLMKAERILAQQLYTDQPDIPAWALESVLGMTQKGIFKGFPDGTFKSRQWLTHAEAICLVAKSQLQWMREGLTAVVPKAGEQVPLGEPVVTEPQPEPAPNPTPTPEPQPDPEPQPEPEPEPVPPVITEPPVTTDPPVTTEPPTNPEVPSVPDESEVEEPQPADPEPAEPEPADPQPEIPPAEEPQTHTAEIKLILPPQKTMIAGVPIELYVVDPDLNTDPNLVETAEVLIFSYDYFESVITMTEISPNSDHFLAWIVPQFCKLFT